jgi:hypothetical protein
MAKRPVDVDRQSWLAQRRSVWRRRNMILNGLMLLAITALLIRYLAFT